MSNVQIFNNLTVSPNPKIPIVSVRELVIDSVESFKVDAPLVKAKVQLSDVAKTCYNIPKLSFSNHYPKNLDEGADFPNVIKAFEQLNKSLDCIKTYMSQVDHDRANSERIEEILKKYVGAGYDSYAGLFYKSDIRTNHLLSDRGSFRVVSLYTVEPKTDRRQKHSIHYLTILFFDPYHLFIPSSDYGTEIYKKVCSFSGECRRLLF
ncbi:hypothetical protein KUF89_05320 [Streptococcus equi subsp. zooepidemicus]|uniref:hypothetical protein n=1 Tax=Streptococcus equi TaxID=1336 RepID=UPI0005BAA54B|nr:hypothetical protein [Streptococcus equi]KIS06230.1 hypothetical protein AT53_00316 [Streptococcus equi subsp. zooepidemicus Sz5]MCD3369623.1 hypothetical protein [Streptococcus equi subsp. zooepidemicus]MCD3380628.1 hypothetical protein [Streptococcus equi subsp. zooepidemicus]MCD3462903.1 hypothetical protein [Streptococcus equi subsp. zooepidemicus]MDI5915211.1 hypothetical protein [Streptococcus equi subsp. zooepidemicus]